MDGRILKRMDEYIFRKKMGKSYPQIGVNTYRLRGSQLLTYVITWDG